MSGATVGAALDRVLEGAPRPRSITVGRGTEFQSRTLEDWAYRQGVQPDLIRPAKPIENAFIESFNGRLRDECLNVHQLASIADAQTTIEAWRRDYNEHPPRLARPPDAGRVRRPMSGHEHRRSGAALVVSGPTSEPRNTLVRDHCCYRAILPGVPTSADQDLLNTKTPKRSGHPVLLRRPRPIKTTLTG